MPVNLIGQLAIFVPDANFLQTNSATPVRHGRLAPCPRGRAHTEQLVVLVYDIISSTIGKNATAVEEHHSFAQPCDSEHHVRHEKHGPAASAHLFHLAQTALLKADVADSQHFIDDQH